MVTNVQGVKIKVSWLLHKDSDKKKSEAVFMVHVLETGVRYQGGPVCNSSSRKACTFSFCCPICEALVKAFTLYRVIQVCVKHVGQLSEGEKNSPMHLKFCLLIIMHG